MLLGILGVIVLISLRFEEISLIEKGFPFTLNILSLLRRSLTLNLPVVFHIYLHICIGSTTISVVKFPLVP